MKFTFIGEEQETTAFGLRFPRGVVVEVTDATAVRKLTNNIYFAQVFDGVEVLAPEPLAAPVGEPASVPKRRGRPPKAK